MLVCDPCPACGYDRTLLGKKTEITWKCDGDKCGRVYSERPDACNDCRGKSFKKRIRTVGPSCYCPICKKSTNDAREVAAIPPARENLTSDLGPTSKKK